MTKTQVRDTALSQAVRLAEGGHIQADDILGKATEFEDFLNGKAQGGPADEGLPEQPARKGKK